MNTERPRQVIACRSDKENEVSVRYFIYGNITEREDKTLRKACEHTFDVINSENFDKDVRNYEYGLRKRVSSRWKFWDKRTALLRYNGFAYTSDDNEKVLSTIKAGLELNEGAYNYENSMDIHLKIDRTWYKRGVLGYTYPSSIFQWIYAWFLKGNYRSVAGNIFHEWLHKLGYQHPFKYTSDRRYSVPYVLGYYIRDVDAEDRLGLAVSGYNPSPERNREGNVK